MYSLARLSYLRTYYLIYDQTFQKRYTFAKMTFPERLNKVVTEQGRGLQVVVTYALAIVSEGGKEHVCNQYLMDTGSTHTHVNVPFYFLDICFL